MNQKDDAVMCNIDQKQLWYCCFQCVEGLGKGKDQIYGNWRRFLQFMSMDDVGDVVLGIGEWFRIYMTVAKWWYDITWLWFWQYEDNMISCLS